MAMSDPVRQWQAGFRPLVAFDFDGTLTCRDSFLAYLSWRAGPWRFRAGLPGLAPSGLSWLRDRDRGRLKEALITRYLKGATRQEVERSARAFATLRSASLLRPDALYRWREWRARGATLIIVTASPEILVGPFAHGLGADLLIGTRLAFDAGDRVTGRLAGANCRGAEKVARLREVFGDAVRLEAAYGDSDGDTQMLALADEAGLRVFGARPSA
jgi:phosphatidylglycerophosphatase C